MEKPQEEKEKKNPINEQTRRFECGKRTQLEPNNEPSVCSLQRKPMPRQSVHQKQGGGVDTHAGSAVTNLGEESPPPL